jgi:hypothetical protein
MLSLAEEALAAWVTTMFAIMRITAIQYSLMAIQAIAVAWPASRLPSLLQNQL